MSGREPDPAVPFTAVLLVAGATEVVATTAGEPTVVLPAMVEGVDCRNGHFNDPGLRYCQRCGIAMHQQTLATRLAPRPPLGVLLTDDGVTFRLDTDYVVGRRPEQHPDVRARRARQVRLTGEISGVSRLQLRIQLRGWQVAVVDLGSANGTMLREAADADTRRVPAGEPVVIRPGTQIEFAARWLRYESHRNP
ncbi:FHA domain-containing protein [Micromonospora sp. NBC_00821]|uniref:FHA domain-containing protein n=2 Tax=Micromonospora TaxID=1873 RepID=UPI002ED67A17|nr:FHA domain-containing protein [Micromonospora sp. NBC_00821]